MPKCRGLYLPDFRQQYRVKWVRGVLVLSLHGLANLALAQTPSASCPEEIVPLTITAGEGVPLPRTYSNPTDREVEIVLTMQANQIFGPTRVVSRVSLPPDTGRTMSESPVYPTTLNTPTRTASVVFEVSTDRHGVVGRCAYQLTVGAPPPTIVRHPIFNVPQASHLVQIPIRMCVIDGSILSGTQSNGTIGGSDLYAWLLQANEDIWYPQAQIAFSTSIDQGFPVIADPGSSPNCSATGNVEEGGFGGEGEAENAGLACAAAWDAIYPGRLGLPVVFVRDICSSPATGVSSGAPSIFQVGRSRNADLCSFPRNVQPSDLMDGSEPPFTVLIEPGGEGGSVESVVHTLAHELGHNLFLGHGNGLDDDNDGAPVGRMGARLYDSYCDPSEGIDSQAGCGTGRFSLMSNEVSSCSTLLSHQIETARDIGRLMPGARDAIDEGLQLDNDR